MKHHVSRRCKSYKLSQWNSWQIFPQIFPLFSFLLIFATECALHKVINSETLERQAGERPPRPIFRDIRDLPRWVAAWQNFRCKDCSRTSTPGPVRSRIINEHSWEHSLRNGSKFPYLFAARGKTLLIMNVTDFSGSRAKFHGVPFCLRVWKVVSRIKLLKFLARVEVVLGKLQT